MYKNDIPEHYAVHSNVGLNTKSMPDTPNGMGQSLEELNKDCCVLHEQLCMFRDKVSPLLKQPSATVACDTAPCGTLGVSERTQFINTIRDRVHDIQRLVDTLIHDIDL